MSDIAYYRVSTGGQSIEAQRHALGGQIDKEFFDEGVSGGTRALDRPAFSKLMSYVREGDAIYVVALDRLGRDALDVQATVRHLLDLGVEIKVPGLGTIGARGIGEVIVAVLAQMADLERQRIIDRCEAGRQAARASLAATGRTHRGKTSLGRPKAADAATVIAWRVENQASIAQAVAHFGISRATVQRYCAGSQR